MTSPGGGTGGGDINLATLWIPIVPETSHIGEAARRAGEQMKREMMYGFGSFEEFGSAMGSGIMRGVERADLPGMFDPVLMAISGKQALMIGAVSGAVTAGLNAVTGAVESMLEIVVKGAEEIGKEIVEVGLKFDELNKDLILYTDAATNQLEQMQEMAHEVYGELDVNADKLGKNMAILSKQFNLSGEDLKKLTYEVTELEGRFGGFDVRSLSAAMHQFGVEGKDVSEVLRTIVFDARSFGIESDALQRAMVQTGPVFEQLHIGVYAASEAMSKILQLGDQPRDILLGISKAATEMGKTGSPDDLKTTIEQIIKVLHEYKAANNEAAAQELASTYFGPRYWAQTLQSLEAIEAALHNVDNAARGAPIEKVVDDSRTVVEEWERLQHQGELFLQPVGESLMKSLQEGLKGVKDWFDENHDAIMGKIDQWGHAFINAIPAIKEFVADGIELFGVFFDATIHGFSDLVKLGGMFLEVMGQISGSDKTFTLGQSIVQDLDKLDRVDFSKITGNIGEAIRNWDTTELQHTLGENLDDAINKAITKNHVGEGIGGQFKLPFVIADPKGPDGAPIDKTNPGKSLFGIDPNNPIKVPMVPTFPGSPGTPGFPGFPGSPGGASGGPGSVLPPGHQNDWITGDQTDSRGWWDKPPFGPIPGVGGWLRSMFGPQGHQSPTPYPGTNIPGPPGLSGPGGPPRVVVPGMPGIPGSITGSGYGGIDLGSGGFDWDEVARAEASNNWANPDTGGSGHYGGLQFAQATWDAFGGQQFAPRPDYASREQQIIVANRTAFTGFGGSQPQGLGAWETVTNGMARVGGISGGMAAYNAGYGGSMGNVYGMGPGGGGADFGSQFGGAVGDFGGLQQVIFSNKNTGQKTGEAGPYSGGGAPGGGGNQLVGPGTANPGYYAANWEEHTNHVHTSWIKSPSGEPYGLPANTVISAGGAGFPDWVYALGQQYGLIPSTYSGHQVLGDGLQHGIDWTPAAGGWGSDYSGDQIDDLQTFASSMAIAGAGGAAGGMSSGVMQAGFGTGGGGGGGFGAMPADWTTHGHGGGGSPGPRGGGGGGGHGGGGGQPYDPFKIPIQIDQRTLDLARANDRIRDLSHELEQDEQKLPLLKQKMDAADTAIGGKSPDDPLYPGLKEKQMQAHNAYDELIERIRRLKEEDIPEAGLNLDKTQMKAQEPLKGGGGSLGKGQYGAAEQLGAGFLSGIFSDLGMGNVLGGKTPDQWGIVRLLGGLAGYGVGMGNSILGMQQGVTGGVPHVGGMPGIAQGAANAIGLPGLPSITSMLAPHSPGPGNQQHLPGPTSPSNPGTPQGKVQGGPYSGNPYGTSSGNIIDASITVKDNNFRDRDDLVNHIQGIQNSRAPGIQTGLPA